MRKALSRAWVATVAAVALAGCNTSTGNGNGNGNGPVFGDVIVLNSVGRTVTQYDVGSGLTPVGSPVLLPSSFDGMAIDVLNRLFVTTSSRRGGGQVVFGDLATGELSITTFPAGAAADPSRASLFTDANFNTRALVATRGTNNVYVVTPGDPDPVLIAEQIGEFVERALPAPEQFVAVDANLDDVGGTYQPLEGDPRVYVFSPITGAILDQIPMAGVRNVTEALFTTNLDLVVLSGGTFGPLPDLVPNNDGNVVIVSLFGSAVAEVLPLDAAGISIKAGRNGLFYVTRTTDYDEFDILVLDGSAREWIRGPSNPIVPQDGAGQRVNCWVVTALVDGRLLCATFDATANGRLLLLDAGGGFVAEAAAGVGATDIAFP